MHFGLKQPSMLEFHLSLGGAPLLELLLKFCQFLRQPRNFTP